MKIRPTELRDAIDRLVQHIEDLDRACVGGPVPLRTTWLATLLVVAFASLDQLAFSRRALEMGLHHAKQQPSTSPAKVHAVEEMLEELDTFATATRKRLDALEARASRGG